MSVILGAQCREQATSGDREVNVEASLAYSRKVVGLIPSRPISVEVKGFSGFMVMWTNSMILHLYVCKRLKLSFQGLLELVGADLFYGSLSVN